jgi:hypothetical protein
MMFLNETKVSTSSIDCVDCIWSSTFINVYCWFVVCFVSINAIFKLNIYTLSFKCQPNRSCWLILYTIITYMCLYQLEILSSVHIYSITLQVMLYINSTLSKLFFNAFCIYYHSCDSHRKSSIFEEIMVFIIDFCIRHTNK